jgi:glutathione peroxidase
MLDFESLRGHVTLVVNVASQCGFTPQYQQVQALHEAYESQGLRILAFPCNQFGGQEPGSDDQIQQFCKLTYDVSFPVLAKVQVNGPDSDPVFVHLKKQAPGLLGSEGIKWNFTKFLADRSGRVVDRFAPNAEPASLQAAIEALL